MTVRKALGRSAHLVEAIRDDESLILEDDVDDDPELNSTITLKTLQEVRNARGVLAN